jgi:hypothetical protein
MSFFFSWIFFSFGFFFFLVFLEFSTSLAYHLATPCRD